jgi:hypothetical protein
MEFPIEKFVSNFIASQFPQFYREDGENFILFMKAYYEWMESSGNPVYQARRLYDYRDIDNTLEDFLEYFQKKYLYGIPFRVIANKRFLLKHILDVYRSKGTIQCYRLLFKLLYNEDIEIYLPGRDVLRASDGTWNAPKYLEISDNDISPSYIGKTIVGTSSGTTAIVENYIEESYNTSKINILYISNILPRGGQFFVGEKITESGLQFDTEAVTAAPTILGSLDKINVINGGQGYTLGDVIKLVYRDVSNGDVISYGTDGILKVTKLSTGLGSLDIEIEEGGFGFTSNATTFLYKTSANGQGASFDIGSIIDTQSIQYNTDLICDYMSANIDSATYNFPAYASANQLSTLQECFSYSNQIFGSIFSLTNVETGNNYDTGADVFVRSTQLSSALPGSSISYNTGSNTVTGDSNAIFNYIFANDDVIGLKANSSLNSSLELAVIKQVTNSSHIVLYGPPSLNSTASAQYFAAPTILPSQYAPYETPMVTTDGSINGENETITAGPNIGNNIVSEAVAISSGKGYVEGEIVKAYLHSSISNNISVISGGNNYTNGELVYFVGGEPGAIANAYITTNGNGTVVSATVTSGGSGYRSIPNLIINTANGSGAALTVTLQEFNTSSSITGKVVKGGIGRSRGFWSTTRGFLNSDKYIQDSYYYQDYSYEIRVAKTLSDYKDIIYNTFHSSGAELFGKYLKILQTSTNTQIVEESSNTFTTYTFYLLASETDFTADNDTITVDKYYVSS